jgi:hypothetical protein
MGSEDGGVIKPIPTWYNGIQFRSRLEARWAIFFERIGIRADYECEGFEITQSRMRYLPDFYLPVVRMYAEVKPIGDPFTKANAFVDATNSELICLAGPPDFKLYDKLPDGDVSLDIHDGQGYYWDESRFYANLSFDVTPEYFSCQYHAAVEAARRTNFAISGERR